MSSHDLSSSRRGYRPELDGIRAIAILSVLGFHAGFSDWAGGFLGVDIFFVLSGWLICGQIYEQLRDKQFSAVSFFARRIRRLVPAAFLCLITVSIVVFFLFLPSEVSNYVKYLLGSAFFFSNFILAHEAGYFAPSASFNPLLHTWSLSIEEQFYIVMPCLVVLLGRSAQLFLFTLIATFAISIASVLFLDQNFVTHEARYFLSIFRLWEIAAGGLAAIATHRRKVPNLPWVAFLSLVSVIASIILFDETLSHPGPWAMMPVLGTIGLILFARPSFNKTGRFIGSKALSFIGRISYSTYLWHWPLISFHYYIFGDLNEDSTRLLLITLSLLLGYISYRWVEAPIRVIKIPDRNRALYLGSALQALTIVALAVGLWSFGRPFPSAETHDIATIANEGVIGNSRWNECWYDPSRPDNCDFGINGGSGRPLILWGDSMASSALGAFDAFARSTNSEGLAFVRPGCAPLEGISYPVGEEECIQMNDEVLARLINQEPSDIYLFARWPMYYLGYPNTNLSALGAIRLVGRDLAPQVGDTQEIFTAGLRRILSTIPERHRIVLIGPVPESVQNVPQAMIREIRFGEAFADLPREVFEQRTSQTRGLLSAVSSESGITFLDPVSAFCNSERCPLEINHVPVLADAVHLSPLGNELLLSAMGTVAQIP